MSSVYSRAVRKAAELVGGHAQLARVLQVPVQETEEWLAGEAHPPREVFLRLVDLILDNGSAGDAEAGDVPPREASG